MDFFVHLAFDFDSPMRPQYEAIRVSLEQVHMLPFVERDGRRVKLPNNTFAGVLRGRDAEEVIERVRNQFRLVAQFDMAEGTFFVTASPKESTQHDLRNFNVGFAFERPAGR